MVAPRHKCSPSGRPPDVARSADVGQRLPVPARLRPLGGALFVALLITFIASAAAGSSSLGAAGRHDGEVGPAFKLTAANVQRFERTGEG